MKTTGIAVPDEQFYEIFRSYHPSQLGKETEVIQRDLTLEEAQEHCNDPNTEQDGVYFDGYRRQ